MRLTHDMVIREAAGELGVTQVSMDEMVRAYHAKVLEMLGMNRYEIIEIPDFFIFEERTVSGRTPDGQEYNSVPTLSARMSEAAKIAMKGRGFLDIDPLEFQLEKV